MRVTKAQIEAKKKYVTYAVNFRDSHVDNSFSEVLGQVVIKSKTRDVESILAQAVPHMPNYTCVIQVTYIDFYVSPTYQNKFYCISNGEIKEYDGEEDWENFRLVPAHKIERNCAVRPCWSHVIKQYLPSVEELKREGVC